MVLQKLSVVLPRFMLLTFLLSPGLPAGDWPQWRGPSSNGISGDSGLPVHWSAGENIAWKVSLAGLGVSSPIVYGDKVFVTSQKGTIPRGQGVYPQLARDDQDIASRENPIGGRSIKTDDSGGEISLIVEAFPIRRKTAPVQNPGQAILSFTRNTIWPLPPL
jgi:hypothetical protein